MLQRKRFTCKKNNNPEITLKCFCGCFLTFFIRQRAEANYMQPALNMPFKNNNSKQIHTNPLLTFHKFSTLCVLET